MSDHERWRHNWRAVSPAEAVRVELPRSRRKRYASRHTVSELPVGTAVVLSASAPLAARRCRQFAADAGVELDREYLAFPTANAPAYLVEDVAASIRLFLKTVLVAPPGASWSAPIGAVLGALRALNQWRLIRRIAPGRVAVGTRI